MSPDPLEVVKSFNSSLYQLTEEVKQLRWWKADVLKFMDTLPDWQEIGKELDMPLGTPVAENILPAIQKLKAEMAELRAQLYHYEY